MKNNKFIAVTMRVDHFKSRNEIRSSLDNKVVQWIKKIGYEPLLLPSSKFIDLNFIFKNLKISGAIISGGNDIKKKLDRYLIEKKILNYSIKKKLPVLGICHGMQMMSEFEGGKLQKINNHVRTRHNIINKSKSDNIYPQKVNSYHDYTIKKLPSSFDIICTCEKGSIEAIKHKKYKWMGWMWHPERDKVFNFKLLKISKNFFKK